MIVKDMLDAVTASPTKQTVEYYLDECLRNGLVLFKKHAPNFKDIDRLVLDSTRQYQVLRDCINDDDDNLWMFFVEDDAITAFKKMFPTEYDSIKREITVTTN